jgi:hypothetical protein
MTLETRVLDWDRHKNVAWLNQLMGYQRSPLDGRRRVMVVKSALNKISVIS